MLTSSRATLSSYYFSRPSNFASPISFQCPQQPDLQIPISRVNDGVCDCCDGADETTTSSSSSSSSPSSNHCEDGCAELLAAAEAARQALRDRYTRGAEQRAAAQIEFIQFLADTKTKLKQARHDATSREQKLRDTQAARDDAKRDYYRQRLVRIRAVSQALAVQLTRGLSVTELQWLVVHACQLAGEMEGARSQSTNTCVPLRMAALDNGIVWDQETARNTEQADKVAVVAEIFFHNSADENEESVLWDVSKLDLKAKAKKRSRHGRKLMRVVAADDFDDYGEHPEYDDELYDDGDYYGGDEDERDHDLGDKDNTASDSAVETSESDEKTAAFRSNLNQQHFMTNRVLFLSKADELIKLIDQDLALEEDEEQDGDNETSDEEGPEKDTESSKLQFDPIAYKMAHNTLDKRKKSIERGINFAVSARSFLDSVEEMLGDTAELTDTLSLLAIGTLSYGKLSEAQYYEALVSAVPELRNEVDTTQTCSSPWSGICPPRTLARGDVTVPSADVLAAVEAFCTNELNQEPVSDGSCTAEPATASSFSNVVVPPNIPNGYYGYYEVQGRAEQSPLAKHFAELGVSAMGDELVAREGLAKLEDEVDRLEKDVSSLQSKVEDLEESIGGDNPEKFGPDGELHSLKDKCFDVEEGKYVYEVCLFGKAAQKDKGSSSQGTDLGTWSRATTETLTDDRSQEYVQRVWYWENGSKCWNGPQRSATAYVTCGAETKVLSADEPDTCRYVLAMESPVACDDDFRVRHGL